MIYLFYLSIALNISLIISTFYFYQQSRKIKERPESLELQEFLMDLATGGSFLSVKRLPPGDIVMRRKR